MKRHFFIGLLIFCIMNVQGDDMEYIKNEYWSTSWGPAGALSFDNYYFFEDGTFDHEFGYSGGIYWKNNVFGKYNYNNMEKIITLIVEVRIIMREPGVVALTPFEIKITEITDNSITFIRDDNSNNSNSVTMKRRIGICPESYWFEEEKSSLNRFGFKPFGHCDIHQNESDYVCEYWLVDNILYLDVKTNCSGRGPSRKVIQYTTPIKTFIRVKVLEKTVMIESVDFKKILDGSRNWEFKNGQYIINGIDTKTSWKEYNRNISGRK